MKNTLSILILLFSIFGFSQKIKVKNDIAYVDNKEYVIMTIDKSLKDNLYIKSLDGNILFYLKHSSFFDHRKDPKFSQYENCYEVMSPNLQETYFEVLGYKDFKTFLQLIYNENVIVDGKINFENLQLLSSKIGFEFSKKREELKN